MVIYITHALKRLVDEQTGCIARETEFLVSPDGVDLERYANLPSASEARVRLNLPEKFTAAYSGSFYTGRGLDTLLELARAFPNVQFLWIGGADTAVTSWRTKLADAGVENVILPGFTRNADLPLYQAAADILLIPYSRIVAGSGGGNIADVSSPLKLFEYMAAGRAILCSDLPVLREILDETNAVFYATGDLGDLTARFSALLADAEKRKALSQKALADVAQYDWKARMKNIMQAYSKSK